MNEVRLSKTRYECGFEGMSKKDMENTIENLVFAVNQLIRERGATRSRLLELEQENRKLKTKVR